MDISRDEHPANAAPADAGLRCPKCDYNLTGLAEDRCPECGEAFDREQLQTGMGPIPGWESDSNILIRFLKTCLIAWFTPITLGQRFPKVHDGRSLFRFKMAAFGVATGEYLLLYFAVVGEYPYEDAFHLVPLILGAWCAVVMCELCARSVLDTFLEQLVSSKPDRWTGLVGVHRSFLILSALMLPFPAFDTSARAFPCFLTLTCVLALWWSGCLTFAGLGRGYSRWRALPALFFLWLFAAISILLGMVVGVLTGLLFFASCNSR